MPDFDRLANEARQGSRQIRTRHKKPAGRFDLPWQRWLDIGIAVVLIATAVYFFLNPFIDIALATAQAAQPVIPIEIPRLPTTAWCLTGSIVDNDNNNTPLYDDGTNGDWAGGDGIFVLEMPVATVGQHSWAVQACDDVSLQFPTNMSWLQTTQANESLLFTFDTNNRDYFGNQYFPYQYIHHTYDSSTQFTAIGSFQDWNSNDPNTTLKSIDDNLYRLMFRVPEAGTYQAHIVVTGEEKGFGANGRSAQPDSFEFTTSRSNQLVVFMLDLDTGQMSILFNPRSVYGWLAFGGGIYLIGLVLLLAAGTFILRVLRFQLINDASRHIERPCPRCGTAQPKRIRRRPTERVMSVLLRLPMRRYKCRHCSWQGARFDNQHLP